MKLVFPSTKETTLFLMRRCGYGYERKHRVTGEDAFGRRLGPNEYPKFHAYSHKEGDTLVVFLHLDQKRPTYISGHAHSGEYDGEVLEREAERIKILMEKTHREISEREMKTVENVAPRGFKKILKFFQRNKDRQVLDL